MIRTRRDLVTVYPEPAATGAAAPVDVYGNPIQTPTGTGVPVRGVVQPSSSADMAIEGQVTGEFVRFICPAFPAGPWARVNWDGRDWDVYGTPVRQNAFRSLRHVTVTLRSRLDKPTGQPS